MESAPSLEQVALASIHHRLLLRGGAHVLLHLLQLGVLVVYLRKGKVRIIRKKGREMHTITHTFKVLLSVAYILHTYIHIYSFGLEHQ